MEELEKKVTELEKRIKALERWIATHHCKPLPLNIEVCIGKPLPDRGVPIIPNVYDD